MKPLLDYVLQLDPQMIYAEVGLNNSWLDAKHIDIPETAKFLQTLDTEKLDESAAAQIFYSLSDTTKFFIGAKYAEGLALVKNPEDFVRGFLHTVTLRSTPDKALKNLGQSLDANSLTYTNRSIDRVIMYN